MKELSEVEKLFVMEVLDTHGEYIMDLLSGSIEDLNLRITDELLNSLNYKVEQRAIGGIDIKMPVEAKDALK